MTLRGGAPAVDHIKRRRSSSRSHKEAVEKGNLPDILKKALMSFDMELESIRQETVQGKSQRELESISQQAGLKGKNVSKIGMRNWSPSATDKKLSKELESIRQETVPGNSQRELESISHSKCQRRAGLNGKKLSKERSLSADRTQGQETVQGKSQRELGSISQHAWLKVKKLSKLDWHEELESISQQAWLKVMKLSKIDMRNWGPSVMKLSKIDMRNWSPSVMKLSKIDMRNWSPSDKKLSKELESIRQETVQGKSQRELESIRQETVQGKSQRELGSISYETVQGKSQRELESISYETVQGKSQRELESIKTVQGKSQRELESISQQAELNSQRELESISQQAGLNSQRKLESISQETVQGKSQRELESIRHETSRAGLEFTVSRQGSRSQRSAYRAQGQETGKKRSEVRNAGLKGKKLSKAWLKGKKLSKKLESISQQTGLKSQRELESISQQAGPQGQETVQGKSQRQAWLKSQRKLQSIRQERVQGKSHRELESISQQAGFKGKKLSKAIENFSWNIRVLQGQADLLLQAKKECQEYIRQISEAAITLGMCGNRILKAFANSLDPDETPQNVASHLDPNC
ncbi:hypothetical protein DPMN_018341 [Dreissena polymorpha]|uniref:Uncharacterized protein n=1 Tax=Dreissena polymorpha TaxID=45954 RepID=A0A9D4NIJ4_DREPO|nr:hypothetical protein DPMN_018341 [Dreissena polymorpha]